MAGARIAPRTFSLARPLGDEASRKFIDFLTTLVQRGGDLITYTLNLNFCQTVNLQDLTGFTMLL